MTNFIIAGIERHSVFSPNHVGNDAAIFKAVANNLQAQGNAVHVYTEADLVEGKVEEKYIFNMVRSQSSVAKLQDLEKMGVVSVNSGFGIENCTREKMTTILMDKGVPHPMSYVCNVADALPNELVGDYFSPCWVKRADFHAIHKEDVTYVRNLENLKEVMAEYAIRGIGRVVINKHLEGDLVKFYGVSGTDFFYWFYPFDLKHSKFGLEEINGAPKGISFSVEKLIDICNRSASALNVDVYGGDAIVSADGSISIIDFNDWPSFAPCREKGGPAIAEAIMNKIKRTEL